MGAICSDSNVASQSFYNDILGDLSTPQFRPLLEHLPTTPPPYIVGDWKDNSIKTGRGIILHLDEFYYEGEIKNGEMDGEGMIVWADSRNRYSGFWREGRAEGEGQFMTANKSIILKGLWNDGVPVKNSQFQFILRDQRNKITFLVDPGQSPKSKHKSVGTFQDQPKEVQKQHQIKAHTSIQNPLNFTFVFIKFHNQVTYHGHIHSTQSSPNHQIQGRGVMTFPDGSTYSGEFLHGAMHGIGEYKWKDGTSYKGEYRNNKRCGRGSYRRQDGSVVEGLWIDGVLSNVSTLKTVRQSDYR